MSLHSMKTLIAALPLLLLIRAGNALALPDPSKMACPQGRELIYAGTCPYCCPPGTYDSLRPPIQSTPDELVALGCYASPRYREACYSTPTPPKNACTLSFQKNERGEPVIGDPLFDVPRGDPTRFTLSIGRQSNGACKCADPEELQLSGKQWCGKDAGFSEPLELESIRLDPATCTVEVKCKCSNASNKPPKTEVSANPKTAE